MRKPLTEYNIKKLMLKNFELQPNYENNDEFENSHKQTQNSLMTSDKYKRKT